MTAARLSEALLARAIRATREHGGRVNGVPTLHEAEKDSTDD
jgi:hypothetical protein